ncbi:MAG: PAS domain S-box protein, partial [Acetobacteraceae bacterium]|nr:PAS domain S-box protein [Acetobacteraceae bacterium]
MRTDPRLCARILERLSALTPLASAPRAPKPIARALTLGGGLLLAALRPAWHPRRSGPGRGRERGGAPGAEPDEAPRTATGAKPSGAGACPQNCSASERAAIAALAETEARLRALADNLPDGLIFQIVPAPDEAAPWRFTHISNGVERLHGVPAAAAIADPLLLFRRIGPGHRARFVRELARAAAARDTFRIELPFRAPADGGLRWSRLSAAPRTLLDGSVAWDGIEVDITAAKATETALRHAEERFRGLFEAAPFSIVLVDPKSFRVLAFNDRACEELGYTREEFARLTMVDIDALGDMDAIRRRSRAHTLRPGVQEFEAQHRDKDGGVRDVLVRACGIVFDGREVAYTAHHDITDRKAAEAALRAGEAEFRAIFENSAAGMAEVDLRTGRYLRVNRRFCEIVGRDEAELTGGLGPKDIRHPAERDSPFGAEEADASPDGRFESERRYVRPDGAVVWVRGSVAVAARDGEGRPARAAAALTDITAQKRADELQTLLMREVDHRARNALAVVQAMLRLTPAEGPEARRFASTLEGRVAAMARAHTLLSRDRWAGAELRDLAEAELAPYVAGSDGGGSLALDGPPVLLSPEAAQPFGMVLHELATNAAKYGALSRPGGRVEIRWRRGAGPGADGLAVEWRESGGPAVSEPCNRGFGRTLIEQAVAHELDGAVQFEFLQTGLICRIHAPLTSELAAPQEPEKA